MILDKLSLVQLDMNPFYEDHKMVDLHLYVKEQLKFANRHYHPVYDVVKIGGVP